MRDFKDTASGVGSASVSSSPPPQISPVKESAPQPTDWWEGFKAAVEDPDVSTYEFLRDHIIKSLELDGAEDFSGLVTKARQKALKELVEMTDARELSAKLKTLEGNTLLFTPTARTGIKVFRAIVDTYIEAQAEVEKEKNRTGKSVDRDKIENLVSEKLASENVDAQIKNLSKTLEGKDEAEIRDTIKEAVRQLSEEDSLQKTAVDFLRVARKYLTPDNFATIAIHALPLITWKFRWALALGLGAYASRMSVYHGVRGLYARGKGVGAWLRSDEKNLQEQKNFAREEETKALTALKAAGGNVIVIGLSPAVAKVPKMLVGFVNLAIDKSYTAVLEGLQDIISREEEKPGSTPLMKKFKKSTRHFLKDNADGIASNAAKLLKEVTPSRVTETAVEVSSRLPVSKLTVIFTKACELGAVLVRRYNNAAGKKAAQIMAEEREIKEKLDEVKVEIAEVKETFKESVAAATEHISVHHAQPATPPPADEAPSAPAP